MIDLFEHNQTAYESALKLLRDTGKAAIVHPTGTGKSFIGFKLCEEHPKDTVCWLGPSEYIFRTQVENVVKACGVGYGEVLWEQSDKEAYSQSDKKLLSSQKKFFSSQNNILFFTYAKLMLMTEEELAKIQPNYIILDEFHRCGAEMWGQGVQNLLSMYPEVPVLGLSATGVRYLDNRRDMTAELFDGCVASEMTLGEAIVRGILHPPKYVLSLYSYGQDLAKYERRVENTRNNSKRELGEKYLEALRRALEQAEGLDKIFEKHMPDKTGKYIVFCANREHMEEMILRVPEWFGRIDKQPQIYRAYSEDPETSKAFAAFKAAGASREDSDEAGRTAGMSCGAEDDFRETAAEGSKKTGLSDVVQEKHTNDHLKLLFCIDMLNEGIHVEDISGVILFRPTVSPIIYKQQIGRAMTAGGRKETVIFDIVNNISSLYSIGAIEEEMAETIAAFRTHGESSKILQDSFEIVDEVRDCRGLFEELERVLTVSWDEMYREAVEFARTHGHLRVPSDYMTDAGLSLGAWIVTQRGIYNGRNIGSLTAEQIDKLEEIGMCWLSAHDRIWEERFAEAKKQYRDKGNLRPPYISEGLQTWLYAQRRKYREQTLSEERIERLQSIGMIWETDEAWERMYLVAEQYYEAHGNLDIPAAYVTEQGEALGLWHRRNVTDYRRGALQEERKERLRSIGFAEEPVKTRMWMRYYEEAKRYRKDHGHLRIHADYETESGLKLGTWISSQRYSHGLGRLTKKREEMLNEIGMEWQRFDAKWEDGFRHLEAYIRDKRGAAEEKQQSPTEMRGKKSTNDSASIIISPDMEKIGVPVHYVSPDGFRLGTWAANQRALCAKGKLAQWKEMRLKEAGMKIGNV